MKLGPLRTVLLSVIVSLALLALPTMTLASDDNPPWYPSLMAFEHYDTERTHLFEQATFNGSFDGSNSVDLRTTPESYPTPYNIVYLGADAMFVYGGGYGDKGGTGAFVARLDPATLKTIWKEQLIN